MNDDNVFDEYSDLKDFDADAVVIILGENIVESEHTQDVENITVENCVMWCDWGKSLEIWCGNKPCAIRNISFKNVYLIRLSFVAINITTWYGSEMSLVENVTYKDVYINSDSEQNRMSGMIENEENPVYKNRKNGAVTLHIAPEKLGIATGNQGMKKVDSYDGFINCYRNIILDGIYERR